MGGQEPAPAADFDDESAAFSHGLENRKDPRRTRVGVESETAMVDERKVVSVVRLISGSALFHGVQCFLRLQSRSPESQCAN